MITRTADIFPRLTDGALCLTATNRLARQIMDEFDQVMQSSGRTAWMRPSILPFDAWCRQLYGTFFDEDRLLNSIQATYLWETIIERDIEASQHQLLQIAPTAKKAREAERLLCSYNAEISEQGSSEDQKAFLRWRSEWKQLLECHNLVDPYTIQKSLSAVLPEQAESLPEQIFLVGFDDFNPAQVELIDALRRVGSEVQVVEPEQEPGSATICTAPDTHAEIVRCARWVRSLLAQAEQLEIGIVVPALEGCQDDIRRTLQAELDPAGRVSGIDCPLPFNMSLGTRLADEGPVAAALEILSFSGNLSQDQVSWLLRTPYIGAATRFLAQRGRTDFELRRKRIGSFPLYRLKNVLSGVQCDTEFLELTGKLVAFQKSDRKLKPGGWAERFADLLQGCGWPGDRGRTSREYQVVSRFRRLLTELASLDDISGPVRRGTALGMLQRLARQTDFQAESSASRVHVLGLLEAGGLRFDHLWVLGLHAGVMPQPARPNPFLPIDLQRRLRMPHADPQHEYEYAQRIAGRLFASAPEVIVSRPLMVDGMETRPAFCVSGLTERPWPELPSASPVDTLFAARPRLDAFSDQRVAPIVSRKPVRGGTATLKEQALCPFRAFAHHRLGGKGLEESDIGLDNMTRGTLVHSTLEFFWRKVEDSSGLNALSEADTGQLLLDAAEKAVAREEKSKRFDIPSEQRQLEIERLALRCGVWISLEREREPFSVVSMEQLHEQVIGRLHIRTKIDRIDRLADGRLAIIDYKTGKPDPAQWFDQRIVEPQLPIYCHDLDNDEVGAVAFASIRARSKDCRFSGVARESAPLPGINDRRLQQLLDEKGWGTFDQLLENWKGALQGLADDFFSGKVEVDPVEQEKTCQYCDLMTFCRYHESEYWPLWEVDGGT